ncbi:hypothetical protein MZO42_01850 [Sphingomonas psychrotolerans]|uniref:Lipoprotein n=1 Tax=Sphingomonas psychrotolerans TaxID=1327635 RepID=A0ABU3MZI4_9SPHN|nr:hypothetical protein [Sphingomonas psychrotolerans]MDT8757431.1 hypothetical protein [Sphingomonas psychrotolerans]
MKLKRFAMLGTVAGALALSACGGKDEADAPVANAGSMTPIDVQNDAVNTTVPTEAPAAPRIDNATTEAAPETAPALSQDEQTQDDADATGMTARVSRDEGGNEAQPAN